GSVTLVGDLFADLPVGFIVENERVAVEDRILAQPERLMNLKVEDHGRHGEHGSRLRLRADGEVRVNELVMISTMTITSSLSRNEVAKQIAEVALLRGEFTLRSGRKS